MLPSIEDLEHKLGHRFSDRSVLARALTHRSHTHETQGRESGCDNEQLEFLGDAVLGFLVSARLVETFPQYPEGRLSKWKAHLVSSVHLVETARALRLGDYLQLGRGEELTGGRTKRALLVNAVEAVIAALYLDGGVEAARQFVDRYVIGDALRPPEGGDELFEDYKSALQEWLQAAKMPQPRYLVVQERGPQHRKTFTIEVRVGSDFSVQAEGPAKKAAAQKAARLALEYFRALPQPGAAGGADV